MTSLIYEDVEKIIKKARAEYKAPDLRGADLRGADLRGADMSGADLWGADLRGADLQGANLQDADLWDADLRFADLHGCAWGGLQIIQPSYGQIILAPTRKGWRIRIGRWYGTSEELKTIISKDDGWIETSGDENHLPCAYLESVLTLCEAHMKNNAKIIEDLKAKWGDDDN